MKPALEIRGELFLTLETAAECYHVEVRWIEEVQRAGLLRGERVDGSLALSARELDRMAAVLRWHRHHGIELETVLALLEE